MEVQAKRRTLTDLDRLWSDSYKIENTSFSDVRDCEVKPCRQIYMFRYPLKKDEII
jgi:hypothetical protein